MSTANNGRLAGKTALVTGSTRGLGRTMADWLAREGANIVVSGRKESDIEPVRKELQSSFGVTTYGIPADLSKREEAHRLGQEMLNQVGQLDILVNNAGMSTRESFWEASDEHWDYQINVNLRSAFILSQYAARHMIERGIRGRIVNISTIGVTRCHKDGAIYNIAKGGVESMTQNTAFELAPYGISVNCVEPGAIMVRPGNDLDPERMRSYVPKNIPYGRPGHAEDIAAAVWFFCLPESEFTTGQVLLVDGAHASYLQEAG